MLVWVSPVFGLLLSAQDGIRVVNPPDAPHFLRHPSQASCLGISPGPLNWFPTPRLPHSSPTELARPHLLEIDTIILCYRDSLSHQSRGESVRRRPMLRNIVLPSLSASF